MLKAARVRRSIPAPAFPPGRLTLGAPFVAGLLAFGALAACDDEKGNSVSGEEAGTAGVPTADTAGAGQGPSGGATSASGGPSEVAGATLDGTAGSAGDIATDQAGAPSSGSSNGGGDAGRSGEPAGAAAGDVLDASSEEVDSGNDTVDAGASTPDSGAVVGGLEANGVATARQLLSQTGLYSDISSSEALAPGVAEYQPQFQLWSDGATKRRYLYIPDGESIDTSDIDEWNFPVGTKIWKEFSRDGVRVETRLLEKLPEDRLAEGLDRWLMLAYVWNDTQTEAVATPLGMENASGTDHDVPDRETCSSCHDMRREKPLGVSAVQLAHDGPGLTLDAMVEQGLVSDAPPSSLQVPGDDLERSILGYVHANCGHCHRFAARANQRVPGLRLWLESESLESVETTEAYVGLVNAFTESADGSMLALRISGQDVAGSELLRRITLRDGSEWQMPPVGTELVDEATVSLFQEWIATLPVAE